MSIVQVIRRADGNVIDPLSFTLALQFLYVPVEAFEFGKEVGFGEKAVQDAD